MDERAFRYIDSSIPPGMTASEYRKKADGRRSGTGRRTGLRWALLRRRRS